MFKEKRPEFKAKYDIDYWVSIDCFFNDLLAIWKEKVLKYYIKKFCHYGNILTLRAEGKQPKTKHQQNNTSTNMIKCFFFEK